MMDIELVYKNKWIIDRIYQESDRLISKISDITTFEDRAVNDVAQYLGRCTENLRNKKHILYLIKRKVWEAENKFKKEEYTNFSNLVYNDQEGEEVEYEPIDVLANVESEVIRKEMTALLAQDDHRNKKILEFWTIGNTNNAYISRSLARSLGGNEDAHRKYIQRFRKSCCGKLSAAI